MKRFLETRAARRTAWTTLVALFAMIASPLGTGRAAAQQVGRTAYLVPFTPGQGVDPEISLRVSTELASALRRLRGDAHVRQPLELINLTRQNPIVKQAIDEGALTDEQITSPPTDQVAAVQFARILGLTTLLVGTVESYQESEDRTSAVIDVTVQEYYIPQQANLEAQIVRTVSKSTRVTAHDEREKALLRTSATQRIALIAASNLLEAPELAPPEQVEVKVEKVKKGGNNALWIALGAVIGVAAIFLLSSINGSKSETGGDLGVTSVRAQSEADSVRVTWNAASGAVGYNVYRRGVAQQTIRARQTGSFTALPNPETNATPTVVGGARTSFIDTTATDGTIYEYAVAGVGADNTIGPLSTPTSESRAGPNIGTAPTLTASSGNGFVSLQWSASSAFVDGYILFRRQGGTPDTSKNSPDQLIQLDNRAQYDDRSVQNGLAYSYIVQPFSRVQVNSLLTGVDSNVVTVTPAAGVAPQAPRNVVATVEPTGRLVISWSANPEANIDYYEILQRRDRSRMRAASSGRAPWLRNPASRATPIEIRRSDPRAGRQVDLTSFQLIGTASAGVTSFTPSGQLPDGTYTFAVRAVNTLGQRSDATATSSVVVNAPPQAPTGVRTVGLDRQVRVSWLAVEQDVITAYNIYRSSTALDAGQTSPATTPGIAKVGSVAGNVLAFNDTNLTNNARFYYVVTAVDAAGAESEFGKGGTSTGVPGTPHTAPATMDLTIDRQNISANGISTAKVTTTLRDSSSLPTAGVKVTLTTDWGTFVTTGTDFQKVDDLGRTILAMTDSQGQINVNLLSDKVTTPNGQGPVNIRAESAELPAGVGPISRSMTYLASRPVVLVLTAAANQLTADGASTTNVTAQVRDALGQPVPDNTFTVDFVLQTTNGKIRRAGDIQQFPFQEAQPSGDPQVPPQVSVNVPIANGQAVAVYQAGKDSSTDNGTNVILIKATVTPDPLAPNEPEVTSQTLVTLVPGAAARIDFGASSINMAPSETRTITVTVKDALNNTVRDGVTVNYTVQPQGPVTVPPSGTTDVKGQMQLQLTAAATAGGAVIIGTIPSTTVQAQLAVTVK